MKKLLTLLLGIFTCSIIYSQTKLADLEATRKGNAVEINWKTLIEQNMVSHQIEKSANGSSFNIIGSVIAENSSTPKLYSFRDATPVNGPNYYRLRSVDSKGVVTFSSVLRVDMGVGKSGISIIPNPVQNGILQLQLQNLDEGPYTMLLYRSNGQQVFTYPINNVGGNSTKIIQLPANIGSGLYILQLTNGYTRINKQVMLN